MVIRSDLKFPPTDIVGLFSKHFLKLQKISDEIKLLKLLSQKNNDSEPDITKKLAEKNKEYLQAQIMAGTVNTLSPYYQDLLDDHIKNTLMWYACVEYIPFSSVQFKSNGAVKQQSEQGVAPSKTEVDYLKQIAQTNADYYALRLQNYLIAYANKIPQYLQSVGNQTQIYPDQTNQYFGGIQL